jgi:hypothetical protein
MALITPSWATSRTAITMDLANLATSSTLVAGRESSQIDNSSDKYMDAWVDGTISVGTTPTANTQIIVYCWGSHVSLATTAIDVLDGTDSAETLTNTGVLNLLRPLQTISVLAATSDVAYPIIARSVTDALGLPALPKFWGLFVVHNTGVNLRNNAVNTNSLGYVGVKFDVT